MPYKKKSSKSTYRKRTKPTYKSKKTYPRVNRNQTNNLVQRRVLAMKKTMLSGYLNLTLEQKMLHKLRRNTIDLTLCPDMSKWLTLKNTLQQE